MSDLKEPIPIEFLGRARDFLRRVEVEYTKYNAMSLESYKPIMDRMMRYPLRNLRPQHIVNLVCAWQNLPSEFRLHLDLRIPKPTRLEVFEIRIGPCKLRDYTWLNEEKEANLAISNFILTLGMPRLPAVTQVCTHIVSRHALARRFQRCNQWDDESVMRDLGSLMQVQPDAALNRQSCVIPWFPWLLARYLPQHQNWR